MEREEDVGALDVGELGALVEGRAVVPLAGQDDLEAVGLEQGREAARHVEREVLLLQAGGADRAVLGRAVAGVEHHAEGRGGGGGRRGPRGDGRRAGAARAGAAWRGSGEAAPGRAGPRARRGDEQQDRGEGGGERSRGADRHGADCSLMRGRVHGRPGPRALTPPAPFLYLPRLPKAAGRQVRATPSSSQVRTRAFQARDTGSNPVGVAILPAGRRGRPTAPGVQPTSASIFAAQMKSFSDSPFTEWVEKRTRA